MRLTMAALKLLIITLILYGLLTLQSVGLSLTEARRQLETEQATAAQLRRDNALLGMSVSETDEKEKWEYIARQQLGLVHPNEIVTYNVGE